MIVNEFNKDRISKTFINHYNACFSTLQGLHFFGEILKT